MIDGFEALKTLIARTLQNTRAIQHAPGLFEQIEDALDSEYYSVLWLTYLSSYKFDVMLDDIYCICIYIIYIYIHSFLNIAPYIDSMIPRCLRFVDVFQLIRATESNGQHSGLVQYLQDDATAIHRIFATSNLCNMHEGETLWRDA